MPIIAVFVTIVMFWGVAESNLVHTDNLADNTL